MICLINFLIISLKIFKVKKFIQNLKVVEDKIRDVEERDRVRNWQPPIDGTEIMDLFGIKAGREIGVLKNALREAILDGEIKNDYSEGLDFIIKKGKEIGLKPLKNN